jgi:hypothetical protein
VNTTVIESEFDPKPIKQDAYDYKDGLTEDRIHDMRVRA